jgi:hypothetical protein
MFSTDPLRKFAKSQTYPPTYLPIFFPLKRFGVRFRAFLGKESSKTPQKYLGKKSESKVEGLLQKNRQFLNEMFCRVFGRFSAMGVKKHKTTL